MSSGSAGSSTSSFPFPLTSSTAFSTDIAISSGPSVASEGRKRDLRDEVRVGTAGAGACSSFSSSTFVSTFVDAPLPSTFAPFCFEVELFGRTGISSSNECSIDFRPLFEPDDEDAEAPFCDSGDTRLRFDDCAAEDCEVEESAAGSVASPLATDERRRGRFDAVAGLDDGGGWTLSKDRDAGGGGNESEAGGREEESVSGPKGVTV